MGFYQANVSFDQHSLSTLLRVIAFIMKDNEVHIRLKRLHHLPPYKDMVEVPTSVFM